LSIALHQPRETFTKVKIKRKSKEKRRGRKMNSKLNLFGCHYHQVGTRANVAPFLVSCCSASSLPPPEFWLLLPHLFVHPPLGRKEEEFKALFILITTVIIKSGQDQL
jgi:hypothetical protein